MALNVQASLRARQFLRDYLLLTLPAKLQSINAGRTANLKSAIAGPFNIPVNTVLKVGSVVGSEASVNLTAGAAQTAAQVATDINTAAPANLTASADLQGRLLCSSTVAPVLGTPSASSVAADSGTGANSIFGWDTGGEAVINSYIQPPAFKGVADGWPFENAEMGGGFWIILENSTEIPKQNIRFRTHNVQLDVGIMWADPANNVSRNKEPIGQCLRAVREVIYEDRQLGTAAGANGVIVSITRELDAKTAGRPLQWEGSPAFDAVLLKLQIDIYEATAP